MATTTTLLQACLQHESGLLLDFITILEHESQLLEAPAAAEALEALTTRKNRHADQLIAADRTRLALLAQAGYRDSDTAMQAAASDLPGLSAPISQLLELARRARTLNAANGVTISAYLAHGRQAMDDLQRLAGAGALYDAQGRSRHGPARFFTERG